jgi:hypothetical protein
MLKTMLQVLNAKLAEAAENEFFSTFSAWLFKN